MTAENAECVRWLRPIANELGVSRTRLALLWALRTIAISSVTFGATGPDQVDKNVGAAELDLSPKICAPIEEAPK